MFHRLFPLSLIAVLLALSPARPAEKERNIPEGFTPLFDGKDLDGWKVGVDGSVALINVGVGGSIDTSKVASPIVGFIFDGKGLMYNLTLEGSKISRMDR